MSEPNYRFSILIKRPGSNYSEEELALMSEKERHYLQQNRMRFGTGYMQLEDPEGNIRSFLFGVGPKNKCEIVKEVSMIVGGPAALSAIHPNLGTAAIFLSAALVGTGKVKELEDARCYDDRMDYAITREKYDSILSELTDGKSKFMSTLLRNCVGYAVDIARRHQLDAPPCILMTPAKMSGHIQRTAEKYNAIQDEFAEADAKINAMFSEQEPAPVPKRIKGMPMTLADRLKSGGLGLD